MRMIDADVLIDGCKRMIQDIWNSSTAPVSWAEAYATFIDDIETRETIPTYGQWTKTADRPPELPDRDYCSVMVITCNTGDKYSCPMQYERAIVRGKRVERWRYYWDRLADYVPDYWMPLPEPTDKQYKCRYADDNGVCSKCSGNGEIIYCVEGPCPYDMPGEV